MNAPASLDLQATLAELTDLGMRTARAVVRLMEIEQEVAKVRSTRLPGKGHAPSLNKALAARHDIDGAAALAGAGSCIGLLSGALDGLSASVRHSIALRRRLQTNWPPAGAESSGSTIPPHQAMKGLIETIRRDMDEDLDEDLFDDLDQELDEDLDDGLEDILTLPVEEVVRGICLEIRLAAESCGPLLASNSEPPSPPSEPTPARPPDTE